jgi:hypothetical protein
MSIKSAAHLADAPKLGEPKYKRRRVNRAQRVGDADTTGTLTGAFYGPDALLLASSTDFYGFFSNCLTHAF